MKNGISKVSHNRGGHREGAGRPAGETGKELKKVYSLRAYPSDVAKLEMKLQKLLDRAIREHLENTCCIELLYFGEHK